MRLLSKNDLEHIHGGVIFEALAIGNLALTCWFIVKSYDVMKFNLQLSLYHEAQLAKLPHYDETRNDLELNNAMSSFFS